MSEINTTAEHLLSRASPWPLGGPRPNLVELALDDLKFLLAIAQKHEPGSYRASGTIADLEAAING